ncbi:MAG: hypothetical protein V7752_11180 [Halopseudomonas sp.]
MVGNCKDCGYWQFQSIPELQTQDEQDGYGLCGLIEVTKGSPQMALARLDDDLTRFQTRHEFGCIMHQKN